MATLPDGGSISVQITEGFNVNPPSNFSSRILSGFNINPPSDFSSRIGPDGFNIVPPAVRAISVSKPGIVTAGKAATFSGSITDETGSGINGETVEVTVTDPEGNSTVYQTQTGVSGGYAAETDTLTEPGDYTFEVFAAGLDRKISEGFNT